MPVQRPRLMGVMVAGLLAVSRVSAYADAEQSLGAPLDRTLPSPPRWPWMSIMYVMHDERSMIDEKTMGG